MIVTVNDKNWFSNFFFLLYRISIQIDVMHGSCLLMEFVLQSMTQLKQSIVFQLLEEIVLHTLWIMSELIKRGRYDPSQGDDNYRPEEVVKLVVGWMMTPEIVGFEVFGGRALSRVQTELKVIGKHWAAVLPVLIVFNIWYRFCLQ